MAMSVSHNQMVWLPVESLDAQVPIWDSSWASRCAFKLHQERKDETDETGREGDVFGLRWGILGQIGQISLFVSFNWWWNMGNVLRIPGWGHNFQKECLWHLWPMVQTLRGLRRGKPKTRHFLQERKLWESLPHLLTAAFICRSLLLFGNSSKTGYPSYVPWKIQPFLVGGLEQFLFSIIYGMSSFPLALIFFKMVKTTNQF